MHRTLLRSQRWRPDEWCRIEAQATACRMPTSGYVRLAALGRTPRAFADAKRMRAVVELTRIGAVLQSTLRAVGGSDRSSLVDLLRVLHADILETIDRL